MREFPRMVYRDGVVRPGAKHWRIVKDAAQEANARREGFFFPGSDMRSRFNGADPKKFDHDGKDGPGGAPKGGLRKRGAK